MPRMPSVKNRVAAGVAWLDTQPIGTWEPMILGPGFNLRNPCDCVLGCIFGKEGDRPGRVVDNVIRTGFSRACQNILKPAGINPVLYGFDSNGQPGDYAALQAEWIRVAKERHG